MFKINKKYTICPTVVWQQRKEKKLQQIRLKYI